jgi:hypothetical protein
MFLRLFLAALAPANTISFQSIVTGLKVAKSDLAYQMNFVNDNSKKIVTCS